jgi:hypothetical protein
MSTFGTRYLGLFGFDGSDFLKPKNLIQEVWNMHPIISLFR